MIELYRLYWRTARDIALLVLTIILLMSLFGLLVDIATPILLALIVFMLTEPLARRFHRWKIKKTIASALALGIFLLGIFVILGGMGAIAAVQLLSLHEQIESHSATIQQHIVDGVSFVQSRLNALPPDAVSQIQSGLKTISTWTIQFMSESVRHIARTLSSISTGFFNFILALILSYFLSIEWPAWKRVSRNHMPQTIKTAFDFLKRNVWTGIASYIRSQCILILCTFVLVWIGLLILGVNNALSIALLAALFDVLPLLGVSTVFLPWIGYCFIVGDSSTGIGLTIVWIIVLLFRQIMEPRITGDSLGVSAFTVLSAMIVSLSVFGVAGLLLAPVLILLLKALISEGHLKRWIYLPPEEFRYHSKPSTNTDTIR